MVRQVMSNGTTAATLQLSTKDRKFTNEIYLCRGKEMEQNRANCTRIECTTSPIRDTPRTVPVRYALCCFAW
jgi:tmRNA-binding protein